MARANKGIVLSVLVLSSILLSSIGLSQSMMNLSGLAEYKWYIVLSGIAAVFLIVAGLFLVRRGSKYGALVTKLGFFMIAVTIFVAELAIIFGSPYFQKYKGDYYKACGEQKPEYWIDKLACYTVGYVSSETAPGGKTVFAISLLVYFALVWSIMYDLANSIKMPSNKNARRVFSFALAYIALRGWLITYFVQFVEYGAVGLSAFYITVFFIGAVWNLVNKRLAGWFASAEITDFYKKLARFEKNKMDAKAVIDLLIDISKNPSRLQLYIGSDWLPQVLETFDNLYPGHALKSTYISLVNNNRKRDGTPNKKEVAKALQPMIKKALEEVLKGSV